MPEHIILYSNKMSSYCQRVEIALIEAKADYTTYEIDLYDKPPWYVPKVNPASKVPAMVYGGSHILPEDPPASSLKLAESLILLDFVADLYPDSGLMPAGAIPRAKTRFFMDAACAKLLPAWDDFFKARHAAARDVFLAELERVQGLLPPDGGFAVGAYTLADVVMAPWLARMYIVLENEVGAYPVGEGKRVLAELAAPRFARLRQYWADLKARPSFRATFDEEYVTKVFVVHHGHLRQKAQQRQ